MASHHQVPRFFQIRPGHSSHFQPGLAAMGQADAEPSMVEEKVEKEPGGDQMNNSPGEYSSGVDIIVLKVINHKKKHQKTSKKTIQVTKVI